MKILRNLLRDEPTLLNLCIESISKNWEFFVSKQKGLFYDKRPDELNPFRLMRKLSHHNISFAYFNCVSRYLDYFHPYKIYIVKNYSKAVKAIFINLYIFGLDFYVFNLNIYYKLSIH